MNKNDRKQIAIQNFRLIEDIKLPVARTIKVDYSYIPEAAKIKTPIIAGPVQKTTVSFHRMKTDECAIHYFKNGLGKNIVVMNFANRIGHGGGYLNGAMAQEEELCRVIPELYSSISQIEYPFKEDSILITPNTKIMSNNTTYALFTDKKYYPVSVVTAAAPNLRHEAYDESRIIRTLENMYLSIYRFLPETDTLILGAWGCGAFGNDPVKMSRIMNQMNLMYGGGFKHVVFAVPDIGPNKNADIYEKNITVC